MANDLSGRQILARLDRTRSRSTPGLRELRRALSREVRESSGREVLDLIGQLIDEGAPRWFAYEMAHHHRAAMAALTARRLDRLGRGLSSWDQVDPFGCYLLGPAWREGAVTDAVLTAWAKSRDRWRRRAALVATVALNIEARGGTGDARRTLLICDLLIDDRDDMVVKALSWALRALAPREPACVRNYIETHDARLAARVKREVRNKLTTGLKNP
jgi:3-methyladenine DNA glycosylase AlkD